MSVHFYPKAFLHAYREPKTGLLWPWLVVKQRNLVTLEPETLFALFAPGQLCQPWMMYRRRKAPTFGSVLRYWPEAVGWTQ